MDESLEEDDGVLLIDESPTKLPDVEPRLIMRRNLAAPTEIIYHFSNAPMDTPLRFSCPHFTHHNGHY